MKSYLRFDNTNRIKQKQKKPKNSSTFIGDDEGKKFSTKNLLNFYLKTMEKERKKKLKN